MFYPLKIWLVVFRHPSEKYDFVSWDDYSQYKKKIKMFQTTNQFCYAYSMLIS
jgi:hypothetical protein